MMQEPDQCWKCGNGHVAQMPTARYLAHAQVADCTSSLDIQLFHEGARSRGFFDAEADTLHQMWDDPYRVIEKEQLLQRPLWKRVCLRLTSKKEVWQEEERVKVVAEEVSAFDTVREARRMR